MAAAIVAGGSGTAYDELLAILKLEDNSFVFGSNAVGQTTSFTSSGNSYQGVGCTMNGDSGGNGAGNIQFDATATGPYENSGNNQICGKDTFYKGTLYGTNGVSEAPPLLPASEHGETEVVDLARVCVRRRSGLWPSQIAAPPLTTPTPARLSSPPGIRRLAKKAAPQGTHRLRRRRTATPWPRPSSQGAAAQLTTNSWRLRSSRTTPLCSGQPPRVRLRVILVLATHIRASAAQ